MTSPLRFDTTGLSPVADMLWRDGRGDHVMLKVFDAVPDLPAPLTDMTTVRRQGAVGYAKQGGALLDCDPIDLAGLPALRQVIKLRNPDRETGGVYLGSLLIPRSTAGVVLLVQCVEDGITGIREAVTMARTGPDQFYRPNSYAPDIDLGALGALPTHVADLPEYDADFPDHPLTRARVLLHRLAGTVEVSPAFRALDPFTG
jgi:hypothetical protein